MLAREFIPARGVGPSIILTLIVLTGAMFGSAIEVAATEEPRPNFLLFMADDMTYTDAGCFGATDVRTPTLDALAAEGMKFTHCFTASPVCAPTRQQLYTGLFPVKSGGHPNHCKVNDGTKSLPHFLGDLGYRVALAGKTHLAPKESFPFEFIAGTDFGVEAVREFVERDDEQPFCLVCCSKEPHTPWDKGDPSAYAADTLTLPPYIVDTPEMREMMTRYYAEITYLDGQLKTCLDLLEKAGKTDNTLVIFLSEQGANLPHCKWTCYDTGLRAACVARWPGRVAPGSETAAMTQYVDIAPTLLEAAGGRPIEEIDGNSFLDVLEGKASEHRDLTYGVQTTRGISNGSLNYPVRSIRTRTHKYILNLNHEAEFQNNVTEQGMLDSWRREAETDPHAKHLLDFYSKRPLEELYDLREDPFELDNLAGDPDNRELMDDLRAKLEAWMEEQGDRGVATELEAELHLNEGRGKKFAKILEEARE